jgi:hypothetical protein
MKKEDVKPVILTFEDGETYTLEFSKNSVVRAEELGYLEEELTVKPNKMGRLLFHCAFLMHHPKMTMEDTDKILYEDLGGFTDELAARLILLYDLQSNKLMNSGDAPKNPRLKVSL